MNGPLSVRVWGLGILGPGLGGWPQAVPCLAEPAQWTSAPTALPPPARLPAAERRRAGALVKLSLGVADQAVELALAAGHAVDLARMATVFTSSSGDTLNCHALCEALAAPDRAVSPTRFTNSVHNATAGYWHIATASRAPSTSLCGFDGSFAAGLLEAAAQVAASGLPVLLVASDIPYVEPIRSQRPAPDAFGVALLLAPADGAPQGLALWQVEAGRPDEAATPCLAPEFDGWRRAIPAARALPLLEAVAARRGARIVLEGQDGYRLAVTVAPAPEAAAAARGAGDAA